MEERRKFLRQTSFSRGCVYFNQGDSTVECVVRDISPRGARLILPAFLTVPDAIELYLPNTDQYTHAQVLWRRGNEIGLVFTATLEMQQRIDAKNATTERVQLIEREIDGLKRMLRHLKARMGTGETEAA